MTSKKSETKTIDETKQTTPAEKPNGIPAAVTALAKEAGEKVKNGS